MTALPRHSRRIIALLLLGLVLYAGLLCSLGHGQMHPAAAPMPAHCHTAPDMAMPMDHGVPAQAMAMLGPDCFFAGGMPTTLVLFAVLGWLLRTRVRRVSLPASLHLLPPRHWLPTLNPRAP